MYSPEEVQTAIQRSANKFAGQDADLTVLPGSTRSDIQEIAELLGLSKGKTKRVAQRMMDMMRDEEWLIKSKVPYGYISGPFGG
ncbi:hypothetical protein G5C60_06505 [Streptomyces sp. HC44]|uniref:Uncharacterized protein n=1 Tax=Streptomyces scabichelini TaxID=2711217 RepID=A0A6G4V080_9ACTN|nr:hypothetical protein [Streptomyces scabichelini]NGO07310.1 hypothetical protein [Streptomyces scabichelini]